MFDADLVRQQALQTIELEQQSIAALKEFINPPFIAAANAIYQAKGRVVVSGIGKSAIIAQKLVATFNSTGTPSLFMHAADAIHGDLGMIQQDDIVMVVSKSGESPEIKLLIPFVRQFGNPLIALCGNRSSYLATHVDFFIDCTVAKEACPHNLAPTTSTTAQMVMGDALAVSLLQLRGFSAQDFAKFHPGGALGKRLYMRVGDVLTKDNPPAVKPDSSLKSVIYEISSKRLGATAILGEAGGLLGIITDGDIRRALEQHEQLADLKASDIGTSTPKAIAHDALAADALEMMRIFDITQLIVVQNNRYIGILHLHDLLREGII